ncbi:IucA/IucC family protein [Flammeovirga aprica]|uniref:IucA/IucC family siderophore biosynthesis protein n=1 Tax=Flammeovirga aprica JL-4 TaxID=694437 RepID=A0A7X9P3P6_9BACT|nr:IucA/IucC family siderophore biosynthesis protein [Flammeovirga aprica]NME67947.1 IucA/IucC family siderophore biosynthesis protein [Flammeovirga aprica JL-4]
MNTLTLANHKEAIDHLEASTWQKVNLKYVSKAISEFAHEKLISPALISEDEFSTYQIQSTDQQVSYIFRAKVLQLDHWWIKADTIVKQVYGKKVDVFLLDFIQEFKDQLEIPADMLPTYLEEITNTLYSLNYKYSNNNLNALTLANSSFQTIEGNMIEGHPCFVANSGRIGFTAEDFLHYSPEASKGFQLLWLAGHRSVATFTSVAGLNYEDLMHQEMGKAQFEIFQNVLKVRGLDPEDYVIFPMHPWQWQSKLSTIFSSDITKKKLILLGEGADTYQPQQSIRTLFNKSYPEKFYVKTALSIQNMGFLRGLSPYYMQSTPSITEWINAKLQKDEYLQKYGFEMLGEVATLGYRNTNFESLGRTNAYNKMLAVLWRESPEKYLKEGQKATTMASLLHITPEGDALLKAYIETSQLTPQEWMSCYLNVYLKPLLHCLYQHEIAFMPHGENLILRMENNVPVGVFMKDITEEVVLFEAEEGLPEPVQRLVVKTTDEIKALSILTDVFDCFFRFIGQIVEEHDIMKENQFWELVSHCILSYQEENRHLSDKFIKSDLFSEDFILSCLNRLQLQNNKQMVDLTDPVNSLQFIGRIDNPIHQFQPNLV